MSTFLTAANWLLPLLYLALLIDYGVTFFLRIRARGGMGAALLGVVLAHAAFLILRGHHLGRSPIATPFEILSFVALAVGAVYWVLERFSGDRRAGAFVLLVAFAFQYTGSVFLAEAVASAPPGGVAPDFWDQAHVVPSTLAYTALTLAGVYGAMQLVLQRGLKRHRFGPLFDRLPPLELLARMVWGGLIVGLVFLTVSLVSGPILLAHGAPPASPAWHARLVLKIVLGGLAWAVCLVGVGGRLLRRWPMRTVSAVAVIDFAVLVALLVSSAVLA